MFYVTSGHAPSKIPPSTCFVRAPSTNVAKLMATNLGVFPTKVISLPLLADQIPDKYIGRRLSSQDLSEIDADARRRRYRTSPCRDEEVLTCLGSRS